MGRNSKSTGLPLFILMLILYKMNGQNSSSDAPQGCTYDLDSVMWICDFKTWMPPLQDEDFGLAPWYYLELKNINGNIPAGAFSGLNGPVTNSIDTHFYWYCYNRNTTLTRDIFTSNLHWLIQLEIQNCYLKNGLPSRLLENLKSLRYLRIKNGGIEPLLANDALAGLTNLRQITVYAHIYNGNLPSGFFNGLDNLIQIDLRFSKLTFVPLDLLNGLVNLEEIYLSFNNLRTMPSGLFDDLIALRVINLHGNPWNCSCELMWFLPWSDITVGAVCQSPPEVENERFEDAFGLLGCIPSTHTSLSTSVPSESEITETQTWRALTCTERSPSTEERTLTATLTRPYAMQVTATAILTTYAVIATPTPTIDAIGASKITSTVTTIPTLSWTALTAKIIGTTRTLKSFSSISTSSVFVSSAYYISTGGGINYSKRKHNDDFTHSTRNIILIPTAGTFLILLVVGTVLFRYRCRNKGFGIVSANPVNEDEENTDGPDSQGRHRSSSLATNIETE